MQLITEFLTKTKDNTHLFPLDSRPIIGSLWKIKVPQYPFMLNELAQEIEDNNINSASCVAILAKSCEDTIEKQRVLFREEVSKCFPMDTSASKEDKTIKLMNRYFSSVYGDYTPLNRAKELYLFADGYSAFVSSFAHYHADRIGGEHEELQKLLLDNKISPICQPLFLADDYSKLYLLDDDYTSMSYERQKTNIINITSVVYKLLRSKNIISDGEPSLQYWLWNIALAGDDEPAEALGQALAYALFGYKENDCFVIHVV